VTFLKNKSIELLETPYSFLNYKVVSNNKLECLKIKKIGQSAAKTKNRQGYKPALSKVQRPAKWRTQYVEVVDNLYKV
jgi:hypothetical protein